MAWITFWRGSSRRRVAGFEIPFCRLITVAPPLAMRAISFAAASVPVLFTVSRMMSALRSTAGLAPAVIRSGSNFTAKP